MKQLREVPRIVAVLAFLAVVLYFIQSYLLANTLDSIGDEGSYLYKGYMFARGDYYPFQEYTFWTNKSPLAFLIPGYIQLLFGPSLSAGRYFSVLLGVLMLVGVWITARRLGGNIWALISVWIFALSNSQIIIYSEAVTQILVACTMTWTFVLTLGEEQPLWQLVLGSALSMLVVMTRQNLAVFPFFLVLYIFWQYGRRAGFLSLLTCAIIFSGFHIWYWPGILQIWGSVLPSFFNPLFKYYNLVVETTPGVVSGWEISYMSRLQSFVTGIHDHFFMLGGAVIALLLFPNKNHWQSSSRFKMAVFLGTLFFVLFLMHTQASIFTRFCVYCFSGYHAFYTVAGFFFILVVFMNGVSDFKLRQPILLLVLVFFAASFGLYYYQRWGDWILDNILLPRVHRIFSSGKLLTASLRDVFTYSLNVGLDTQDRVAALLGGAFIGGLLIVCIWLFTRFLLQRICPGKYSLTNILIASFLTLGTILPFSNALQGLRGDKCFNRYLPAYDKAGKTLSQLVPSGSQFYWRGSGRQLALMLYLNDIKIFPPQVHAGGGYTAGDSQKLYRLGLYNEELDTQWRDSSDYLAIWSEYMSPELRETLRQGRYEEIPFDMGELSQCEDPLYIFRKIQ